MCKCRVSRYRWLLLFLMGIGCFWLNGCSLFTGKQEQIPAVQWQQAPDLTYEIVSGKDVPQKVYERIFHKQKERFGFTYRDGDSQYIAFGFGTMPTGGYSIQLTAVKDTETKIVVVAEIIAPEPGDVVSDKESHPTMVLRVDDSGKNVQFRLKEE